MFSMLPSLLTEECKPSKFQECNAKHREAFYKPRAESGQTQNHIPRTLDEGFIGNGLAADAKTATDANIWS